MAYILSLALILRLIFFNQSLWLDEASEALALMGKSGPLFSYILADYQPPLYHGIAYVLTHLFGYSEFVLRLPSLISGVLVVYFVVKIGELIANYKIGVIAGILAATNPLLIYYSQEGRTYAMTTFFVTASFYYLLQLLKVKSSKYSILYTLYTILFLWTSYLSWLLLLAQGLYVLWRKRYDILLLQSLTGLTLLAWLPSFLTSIGIGRYTLGLSSSWGTVVGGISWKSLPLTWVKFNLGKISFDNKLLYGVIVGIIGLFHLDIIRRVQYRKYAILLVWLLIPLLLSLITASVLPVYSYFRVLFVLPSYLIYLALGAEHLSTKLVSLLIVIQLACLSFFWFSPQYHREDWRSLSADLLKDHGAAIAMPSREQGSGLYYYGIDPKVVIEPSKEPVSGDKLYYIRYAEDLFDVSGLGQANLKSLGYTITMEHVYPGIQVDIYEKK